MVTYTFTNGTASDADEVNTNFQDVEKYVGSGLAQSAYQILQSNNIFDNKDFLAADEFVTSNGTNSTINTTSSAKYDSSYPAYVLSINDESSTGTTNDPESFTTPGNAFDGDDSTSATKTSSVFAHLGKTFSAKTVDWLWVKYARGTSTSTMNTTIETYNGSSWSSYTTLNSGTAAVDESVLVDMSSAGSIQGIRINFDNGTGNSVSYTVYSFEYGSFNTTNTVISDTGTLTLDGTEKAMCVYTDAVNTANTSISVKAGDGTTQTASQTITNNTSSAFSISTLSSGTLELEFTLSTSNTSETPYLRGWGVVLFK